MRTKLWQITENGPTSLKEKEIPLEERIETWIEEDTRLLREGLTIVGRQLHVEGGIIDLLAIDPHGVWTVIEIKKGTVDRYTVAQALDYASCISQIKFSDLKEKTKQYVAKAGNDLEALLDDRDAIEDDEEKDRDVAIFIVGTRKDSGLERILSFLSRKYEMPVNVVLFDVFEDTHDGLILAREQTELDQIVEKKSKRTATPEEVFELAGQYGIKDEFKLVYDKATDYGMYPKGWSTSIMYTPPANKTRMLITVWAKPTNKGIKMYFGPSAFAEFYPISEEKAIDILGAQGWHFIPPSELSDFLNRLDKLFEIIQQG